MPTLRRPGIASPPAPAERTSRPVVLGTLGVPFDSAAAEFAVDTAVESGQTLICVNAVEMVMSPAGIAFGTSWELDDDADAAALAAPAALAAALGVAVERLRVSSPRPVDALVEVVGERRAGMLVFGPDRARLRPRRYRRAARAVVERCPCLVWLP